MVNIVPENLGTLIAVNRTSHSAVVLSLPCQRTKVQPQALEGSFWFPVISDSQTNNLSQMPSSQGSLLFVLRDSAHVTSSRKPSLTTPCGWIDCPALACILSVCLLTRVLPWEQQCWLSHLHILASNAGPSMEKAAIMIVEYESCLTGGTHCCNASAHKFPITSPWVLTQSWHP